MQGHRGDSLSPLDDEENRSEQPASAKTITAQDVRGLLWDFNSRLNSQDIYFRNQDKLLRNSCLPEFERQKANNKMRFQSKHSDLLS